MFNYQSDQLPYLKSLTNCLNKVRTDGYTGNFKVVNNGLCSLDTQHVYQPADIKTMNFFRFEGIADPKENAVMYIIETCDGLKGTLVNPYDDKYADPGIEAFMGAVKNSRRKD